MHSPLAVDYRGFRLSKISEPQFRHLWWLLFWPLYWLRYPLIERLNPAKYYHPIYCHFDDMIPFQEWFIIPYMLWMVTMIALCLYTLCYDVDTFKRYSRFLVISISISTVIFSCIQAAKTCAPPSFREKTF